MSVVNCRKTEVVECSDLKPCFQDFRCWAEKRDGLVEVNCAVSLPGVGIAMINDDLHIAGIRQVVAEGLKSTVLYSIHLAPRYRKLNVLSLLVLQLLISHY